MKRFAAEVIFPDAAHAADAAVALAELDLECVVDPDAIDLESNYVWALVSGSTELAQLAIGDWLNPLVLPFGGDIVMWGYGEPWKVED